MISFLYNIWTMSLAFMIIVSSLHPLKYLLYFYSSSITIYPFKLLPLGLTMLIPNNFKADSSNFLMYLLSIKPIQANFSTLPLEPETSSYKSLSLLALQFNSVIMDFKGIFLYHLLSCYHIISIQNISISLLVMKPKQHFKLNSQNFLNI